MISKKRSGSSKGRLGTLCSVDAADRVLLALPSTVAWESLGADDELDDRVVGSGCGGRTDVGAQQCSLIGS